MLQITENIAEKNATQLLLSSTTKTCNGDAFQLLNMRITLASNCWLCYPFVNYRVPGLLLTKKIHDFSRTSQDPMKNFPRPFRSPQMFKYKEK